MNTLSNLDATISIKTKILFLTITITIFLSSFFLIFFINNSDRLIKNELNDLGLLLVRNLSYSSELSIASEDEILLRPYLAGISKEKDVVYVAVFNKKGKKIASVKEIQMDEQIPKKILQSGESSKGEAVTSDGKIIYDFFCPIFISDIFDMASPSSTKELAGFARIGLSLDRMLVQRKKIIYSGIAIMLSSVILCLIVSFFLSERIVHPVQKLIRGVNVIAKGDLSHRIDIKSRDEIGKLANAFNNMSSELEKMQDQLLLKEKLAAIGQVAAVVAHELKNPLASIRNIAFIFKKILNQKEAMIFKQTELLSSEVNIANKIVTDLLDYSRQKKLNKSVFLITDIVEDSLKSLPPNDSITIVKSFISNCKISIDPDRIRQVLLNILVNAEQSMEREGEIKITTNIKNGKPFIAISDSGCGMDPELLSHVFEPFYTTKVKGTGLGMAIVQNILRQHNANIMIESAKNSGTTVSIIFEKEEA